MKLCVLSFKECWQNESGRWLSDGGFPMQIAGIGSLFEELTLVIVRVTPRRGGIPLPAHARVVPLRQPAGTDTRRKMSLALHLPSYLNVIREHVRRADVVHVPLPGDIPALALLVTLVYRKRLIARYGSSWPTTPHVTLMNRATKMCMRLAAGGRNVMIATGAGAASPAKNVHWLFATAIGEREVAAIKPDLLRGPGRPLRVVYAGRLSPEKGVSTLFEAMGIVTTRFRDAREALHLTILGDGPERQALSALADRRGCTELIEFAGQVDRTTLLDRMLHADVCVLPSLTESFCKARLDAMLCGLPVVTTEVGFGRELIGADGERGWVVPAGDAAALADVLEYLVKEPRHWPSLRARCRAYVQDRTVEAWVRRIGELCAAQWQGTLVDGKLRA